MPARASLILTIMAFISPFLLIGTVGYVETQVDGTNELGYPYSVIVGVGTLLMIIVCFVGIHVNHERFSYWKGVAKTKDRYIERLNEDIALKMREIARLRQQRDDARTNYKTVVDLYELEIKRSDGPRRDWEQLCRNVLKMTGDSQRWLASQIEAIHDRYPNGGLPDDPEAWIS